MVEPAALLTPDDPAPDVAMPDGVVLRRASAADHDELARLSDDTWGPDNSPGPRLVDRDTDFFDRVGPEGHLVALLDGRMVGYVRMGHPTPLPASRHVVEVQGLGVHADAAGRGIGAALVEAAVADARRRGAHKVSLRVMGTNPRAIALYERLGFTVQGHLKEEFVVEGALVDDLMMCRFL